VLSKALEMTSSYRGSHHMIKDYLSIINVIRKSNDMNGYWSKYQKDFDYAIGLEFEEVLDAVVRVLGEII